MANTALEHVFQLIETGKSLEERDPIEAGTKVRLVAVAHLIIHSPQVLRSRLRHETTR